MNPIVKFITNNNNLNAQDIVFVLNKYKALNLLPVILNKLKKEFELQKQNSITTIQSPFVLDEISKQKIKEKFNTETIKDIINPNILGGFKAYNGNKILDMSLETIIKKIKN